jgi:nucleoid-associated protein YgaU
MIAPALIVIATAGAAAAGLWWSDAPQAPPAVQHAALVPVVASSVSCHRVHLFREGETLETIAEQELGASWRWQEIAVLNRDRLDRALQDGLRPGTPLEIPAACVH